MRTLGTLYHWSPITRRVAILQDGLKPYQAPVTHSGGEHAYPYVCLSPAPSTAWGLSGDMEWTSEIEEWDLWQVQIPDAVEVHVRPNHGPLIEEIKVYGAIPADHVWYVATRTPLCAIEMEGQ